ncbi:MAG: hypothetical protein WD904_08980 [Dehalococcoidia bacterium]
MPRRKLSRKERRDRQEQRQDSEEQGVPVSQAVAPKRPATGVSFTGAAGAALGAGMFLALGVAVGAGAGEGPRTWGLAFAAVGLAFVPALIVCVVRNHPRRDLVLRATTVVALILAFGSVPVFGTLEFATIIAPPTALLAIGAGFVLQGSRAKK